MSHPSAFRQTFALAFFLILGSAPAIAGNKLITRGEEVSVAKSTLAVRPDREWNKMGARLGRNSETWTLDGDGLNDLTFYGGIENDRTLFREVSKKSRPLPHFSSTMLLSDVPALVEASYRIALDTSLISIDAVEPATFAGSKGIRFHYTFTRQNEEVKRFGEGIATIIRGKLYMITFEAPAIYYFDRDADRVRELVATARIG